MTLAMRYLDLMEQVLTGAILEDPPMPTEGYRTLYRDFAAKISGDANVPEEHLSSFNAAMREGGWDYPSRAFTMVGLKRLSNFRNLIERVIAEHIPGDIIETGVWRGGSAIMARAVLAAHDICDRRVICADSFEGLPPPSAPQDAGDRLHQMAELAVSLEEVRANFEKFGLLDDQVVFLKGWFRDTMPSAPVERLAVMRLDGDMYESTIDPLRHLYDRLSPGGFVVVDDYNLLPPCKAAVQDVLAERGLTPAIEAIDGQGVWFRKA
jgi:O-methyltransferase